MLIIEDGTGIDGADSYISAEDAVIFAVKYGLTLSGTGEELDATLRQAYLLLDTYEPRLQGKRALKIQNNIFPRWGVVQNGFEIESNVIPSLVRQAQVYAAVAIEAGYTLNNIDTQQKVTSFSLDGVMSETYEAAKYTSTNAKIQGVENSLRSLTKAGISTGLTRDDYFYGVGGCF